MNQSPDLGRSYIRPFHSAPKVTEPWPGGATGFDSQLQNRSITVERKHITFDLRENPRGRFLRIIEEVSGRRNTIIIPLTGIEDFRDALNEMIKFSKTLSPRT